MQVNPNEIIHVAYNIADPSDTTLYYVQAVMRDSSSNKVLGTVNLVQDPNHVRRYIGSLKAPSMAGNGQYIDIITTVYTDNGYTTPSGTYEEILTPYVVAYRWNQQLGGAGNGDPFAMSDYRVDTLKAVEKLIKKHLKPKKEVVKQTKTRVVKPDMDPLKDELIEAIEGATKDQNVSQDQIDSLTSAVVAAVEDLSTKKIDDLTSALSDIKEKLAFIWENDYLTKMRGDGSLLPPVSSQEPRSASPGVMPIEQVYENHRKRQAGLFGGTGSHLAPTAPDGRPILGEPSFDPTNRAPSEGVVPVHQQKKAAAGIPLPLPEEPDLSGGGRKPSPGVVPHHVIARTSKALNDKLNT